MEVGLLSFSAKDKVHVGEEVSDCLINLIRIADRCDIDLPACAFDKVSKNAKKYPANRVKGLSKKYNEYEPEKGKETEKEKENASNNNDSAQNIDKKDGFTADITIEALRQSQEDFCNARDWIQYHTPRNILLALIGEIGELAESKSVV